jgi:serine/threonine protein kinase
MGINQICFEQYTKRNKNEKELRLMNNTKNMSITARNIKENRINIIIKKTYKKKNTYESIQKEMGIQEKLNIEEIKNKFNKNSIILKKSRKKSIDLCKIKRDKLYNTNENRNILNKIFIKGQLIEQGNSYKVYTGLCTSTGEITTIKVYENLLMNKKNEILRNKEKLIQLDHPNIIKTLSLFEEENKNLMVIYESLTFKNVEQLINKYGILEEKIIQMYCSQLLKGLEYLHERKIYHKNLKTSNIIVGTDGTIKISDCLIDNIILGNEKEFFDNLLNSEEIEYYVPPFYIQYIFNKYKNQENNKNNNNNINVNETNNTFDEWQAYDLWYVGCVIIEVASGMKPWEYYNFKGNSELFNFLNETHLIATIPKKLSIECQELIQILLNHSLTNKKNIYETLFNLKFFNANTFTYENAKINANISGSINIMNVSDSQDTLLGNILEKNKVVNILNSNNGASFTVTSSVNTNEDKSINRKNVVNQLNFSTRVNPRKKLEASLNEINIIQSHDIKPKDS